MNRSCRDTGRNCAGRARDEGGHPQPFRPDLSDTGPRKKYAGSLATYLPSLVRHLSANAEQRLGVPAKCLEGSNVTEGASAMASRLRPYARRIGIILLL